MKFMNGNVEKNPKCVNVFEHNQGQYWIFQFRCDTIVGEKVQELECGLEQLYFRDVYSLKCL